MRAMLLVSGLLTLSGCASLASLADFAGFMPRPDPNQAWVDLTAEDDSSLHAIQVDDRDWADKRYFQVQPGSHELTVRYKFAVQPTNIGPQAEPLWRDCQLNVKYKDFAAGQRYQLEAGTLGLQPWAKLYDAQGFVVSKGRPAGCQRA
ncbi:hypothetical protein [Pseudomonas akapageensis]|uniref:PA0061/PA0062 family lipoprotein n=1 Tax=Pseudomonas akapageensis TaxID=2609961 RepID=UPI00140A11F8|nr:hypothetical protein [Pseudomonas akapageensis]